MLLYVNNDQTITWADMRDVATGLVVTDATVTFGIADAVTGASIGPSSYPMTFDGVESYVGLLPAAAGLNPDQRYTLTLNALRGGVVQGTRRIDCLAVLAGAEIEP
jgi:hypothetical protein